ncbi:MAG TPA: serine hydrolase domain-containing protein [Ktedonobacterales bacterium]
MSVGGFSSARLDHMRSVMAGYVERGETPGLVAAVSRRGEAHIDTFGAQTVGNNRPMRRDSIFRISSMTKPITAAATLLLVEECKLRLDEPVDRLLPELAGRKVLKRLDAPLDETVPAYRPVTVRDLLTFRMGFGIILAPPDTYPIQRALDELQLGQGQPHPMTPPAPDEWMRRFATLPLLHQPGEQWMYNTGSDVLGVLIARASGQPLETFLRERIFEPLGMRDTSFSVPEEKLDRLTTCYQTDPATGALTIYDEAAGGDWSRPPAFPAGSAGLVSTIDDYLAFGQMLLNKGTYDGGRLLSRLSVELMTTDQLTPTQKAASGMASAILASLGWGFGVSVVTRRDAFESVGTFGWAGGMGTLWSTDPHEQMVTILMTSCVWNSASPPNVCLDFSTSAYQAIDD